MASGYMANGSCYSNINDAANAIIGQPHVFTYGTSITPVILSHAPTKTLTGTAGEPGSYYRVKWQYRGTTNNDLFQLESSIFWGDCSSSSPDFFDGYTGDDFTQIGWEIAGLWVLAFCLGMVVRVLR